MPFRKIRQTLGRGGAVALVLVYALLMVLGDVVLFQPTKANAAQLQSRSLTLSSSANGGISTDIAGNAAAAGSGGNGLKTAETYSFTLGTSTATVGSILIYICDDSPLPLASTCTTPTGFTAQNVSTVQTQGGSFSGAFSVDTTTANASLPTTDGVCNGAGTTRTNCIAVKLASATAQTGTPTLTLKFGGTGSDYITNPTTDNHTFYARILVFSATNFTGVVDRGSVANSTTQQIDITAKVQEKLNFSAGTTYVAPTASCTAFSDTGALALGDTNGVLDSSTAYDAHSYFRISTNATNGTVVQYSGDTLKSGSNSIAALSSETLSSPGSQQFGLGLDTANSNHSFTNLTAASGYDEASGNINPTVAAKFNFSTGSVTTPVTIASVGAGNVVSCDTGDVRYIGNITAATAAGIYTTTITYLAVPTY